MVRGTGGGLVAFFFSSRRRHTRWNCDWSSDVCSSDLEVETYMTQHGAKISGPGIALWHDRPDQNPTVAAAFPTGSALPDGDRVHAHELPGVETMACVVHHGGFDSLGPAYNALIEWIQANGYRYDGPSREVYLQYDRNGDPAAYVTEIQVPVAKA